MSNFKQIQKQNKFLADNANSHKVHKYHSSVGAERIKLSLFLFWQTAQTVSTDKNFVDLPCHVCNRESQDKLKGALVLKADGAND